MGSALCKRQPTTELLNRACLVYTLLYNTAGVIIIRASKVLFSLCFPLRVFQVGFVFKYISGANLPLFLSLLSFRFVHFAKRKKMACPTLKKIKKI